MLRMWRYVSSLSAYICRVLTYLFLNSISSDDPYDQLIFPHDDKVSPGRLNNNEYDFNTDHSLGKKLSRGISIQDMSCWARRWISCAR